MLAWTQGASLPSKEAAAFKNQNNIQRKRSSIHGEQRRTSGLGLRTGSSINPAARLTSPVPVISDFHDKNYHKSMGTGGANEIAGHITRFLFCFFFKGQTSTFECLLKCFKSMTSSSLGMWGLTPDVWKTTPCHIPRVRGVCACGCLAGLEAEMLQPHTDAHKEEYNCYSSPVYETMNLTNPHALESLRQFFLNTNF